MIRGIDQIGRAFEKPKKELSDFQLAQQKLARSSYRLLFAGAAFLTFGLMAAKGLAGLIDETSRGKLFTDDFARSVGRLKKSLSEAFLNNFEDEISNITKQIDTLSQNEFLTGWLAKGLTLLVTLSIATGGIAVTGGLVGLITSKLINPLTTALSTVLFTAFGISTWTAAAGAIAIALPLIITFAIIFRYIFGDQEKMREEALAGLAQEDPWTQLTRKLAVDEGFLSRLSPATRGAIENHVTVNMYGNIEGFEGMTFEDLVEAFGLQAAQEIIDMLNLTGLGG